MTSHGNLGNLTEIRRIGLEELSVEWSIKDILSLPAGSDVWYLSPDFRLGNDRWRLRLYLNWKLWCTTSASECLRLGLVKYHGGPRKTFHVAVGIGGGMEKIRKDVKEFWGHDELFWNDFCSKSELVEQGSRLMPDGVLTIRCDLKRVGSTEAADCSVRRPSIEVDRRPIGRSISYDKSGFSEIPPGKLGAVLDVSGKWLSDINSGGFLSGGISWRDGVGLEARAAFQNESMNKNKENFDYEDESMEEGSENFDYEENEESKNEKNLEQLSQIKKVTKKITLPTRHGDVINSLKTILVGGGRADLTLVSGGRDWLLHKAILEARSRHFEALFNEECEERDEIRFDGTADIAAVSVGSSVITEEALSGALQFIYTGEVEHMSLENVCGMYVAAHQFHQDDLKSMCVEYMEDRMCPEIVCDALVVSETYGERDLKGWALECYFEQSNNVISTKGWTRLSKNHPCIIAELFKEFIKRERKKRKLE